jgi:hypothetical protein
MFLTKQIILLVFSRFSQNLNNKWLAVAKIQNFPLPLSHKLKWICGFANAQGGKLYIGIDDGNNVCSIKDAHRLSEDIPPKKRLTFWDCRREPLAQTVHLN